MLGNLDKPPVAVGNVGVQFVRHGEVEIVAEGLEVWKEQQDLSDNDLNVPSLTIVQVSSVGGLVCVHGSSNCSHSAHALTVWTEET